AVHGLGVEGQPYCRVVPQELGVLGLEHDAQAADRVVRRLLAWLRLGVDEPRPVAAQERRDRLAHLLGRRDRPAGLLDDEGLSARRWELEPPDALAVLEPPRER